MATGNGTMKLSPISDIPCLISDPNSVIEILQPCRTDSFIAVIVFDKLTDRKSKKIKSEGEQQSSVDFYQSMEGKTSKQINQFGSKTLTFGADDVFFA